MTLIANNLIDVYGEKIGPYAVGVYVVLCRFADSEDTDELSHQMIAERTQMSRQQVNRAIQTLVTYGLIDSIPQYDEKTGEQRSTLYVLLDISDNDADTREAVSGDIQSPLCSDSRALYVKLTE